MNAPLPPQPKLDALLFAVMVRPPEFYWHNGQFFCSELIDITNRDSVVALPDVVAIVQQAQFIAVVARSYAAAKQAAQQLLIQWSDITSATGGSDDSPIKKTSGDFSRRYDWPNRWPNAPDPRWVTARYDDSAITLSANCAQAGLLRQQIAALCALEEQAITIECTGSTAFTPGPSASDDAAVDAAFISHYLQCNIAVLLDDSYYQQAARLGSASPITFQQANSGSLHIDAPFSGSHAAPLALLLTHTLSGNKHKKTTLHWPYDLSLETNNKNPQQNNNEQSALQYSFAQESFVDELAEAQASDPLDFRLAHLQDQRGSELLKQVATQANWQSRQDRGLELPNPIDQLNGRGLAYCHSTTDPSTSDDSINDQGTRSAWIADLTINRLSGHVELKRLLVAQDAGPLIDQTALQQQLQTQLFGNNHMQLPKSIGQIPGQLNAIIGQIPGQLNAINASDNSAKTDPSIHQDWPVAKPANAELATQHNEDKTTDSAIASIDIAPGIFYPALAAIANALHHATGKRFRSLPFDTAVPSYEHENQHTDQDPNKKIVPARTGLKQFTTTLLVSIAATLAIAWPFKSAIAPITRPAPDLYSNATIERGRLLAQAGNCASCHTELGGVINAGGRAFDTDFGVLYSSNITPDETTGIGRWSLAAFDRAMRTGISRDGKHLYPVFPYNAFSQLTPADMESLYAYLMAQPAVSKSPEKNDLRFPFQIRETLAGWNTLFLDTKPFTAREDRSALWNRGAYLVEGIGHCSACHTPRNVLGAEQTSKQWMNGALVNGWEAPALNSFSQAPIPWTEQALFDYLSTGLSDQHGTASGPMLPVVNGLSQLPEQDVRAIAHYVTSLKPDVSEQRDLIKQSTALQSSTTQSPAGFEAGERIFQASCGACHEPSIVPSFTDAQVSLALNSNLHSEHPDNLIQIILHGIQANTLSMADKNTMPAFKNSLTNQQIADLLTYLRERYASDKSAWPTGHQQTLKIQRYRSGSSY